MKARNAAPSVRRSKKRQPERSRSDCIRRLSAGWFERAIRRGAFENGHELAKPRIKLEVAEMADGHDAALRAGIGLVRQDFFRAGEDKMRAHFVGSHRGGFDGAGENFRRCAGSFPLRWRGFLPAIFRCRNTFQILQRHAPVPRIEPERQRAGARARSGHQHSMAAPECSATSARAGQ